jgi:MSHA biogenesis protein MshK
VFDLKRMTMLVALLVAGTVTLVAAAVLRDPLRPPSGYGTRLAAPVVHDAEAAWVLQSLIFGEERAVAVIDGVAVSRGESYRGARVLKVGSDEVVLQDKSGKKIVLKWASGLSIKMVPADMEMNLK